MQLLSYQAFDRGFDVIIEAKREDGSLLTLASFAEMIELDRMIKKDVFYFMDSLKDPDGLVIFANKYDAYFSDICKKFQPIKSYQQQNEFDQEKAVSNKIRCCHHSKPCNYSSNFHRSLCSVLRARSP